MAARGDLMMNVVCGVIWNERGEVLLCQRAQDKSQGGMWEFPGGKVELGESENEALVRELKEELGCLVAIQSEMSSVEYSYAQGSIKLIPKVCIVLEDEPKALEHKAIQWVSVEAAQQYALAPADVPIVRELRRRL